MVVTPMPALPAPTMTKRCLAMSDRGLSWIRRAPNTPAQAVAAVPCTAARAWSLGESCHALLHRVPPGSQCVWHVACYDKPAEADRLGGWCSSKRHAQSSWVHRQVQDSKDTPET